MARGPLAGAAGPGKFSVRTDGMSLPSAAYGEGVQTPAIQQGAPLAKTPSVNPMSRSEQGIAPSQLERITPLYASTQRPDEPITAGVAVGPGPGPEILGMNAARPAESLSNILSQMLPYDTNGEIAALYEQAVSRGL